MGIKAKIGLCIDCPEGSEQVPLIAKRCKNHYWKNRNKVNAGKMKYKERLQDKKVLGIYFASQTLIMPSFCEECNKQMPTSPAWIRKACIAHILAKRPDYGFPSVAIHPVNKVFLCPDCHANMDNLGSVFILKMKILPVLIKRVADLIPSLTPGELSRVPQYYLS